MSSTCICVDYMNRFTCMYIFAHLKLVYNTCDIKDFCILCLSVYVFTTGPQCEPVNITTCKCEHVNITKCAILYKRLLFIIITVYRATLTSERGLVGGGGGLGG